MAANLSSILGVKQELSSVEAPVANGDTSDRTSAPLNATIDDLNDGGAAHGSTPVKPYVKMVAPMVRYSKLPFRLLCRQYVFIHTYSATGPECTFVLVPLLCCIKRSLLFRSQLWL